MNLHMLMLILRQLLSERTANAMQKHIQVASACKTNDGCYGVWTSTGRCPRSKVTVRRPDTNTTVATRPTYQKIAFYALLQERSKSDTDARPRRCTSSVSEQRLRRRAKADAKNATHVGFSEFMRDVSISVTQTCDRRKSQNCNERFFCMNPAHLEVMVHPPTAACAAKCDARHQENTLSANDALRMVAEAFLGDDTSEESEEACKDDDDDDDEDHIPARSTVLVMDSNPDDPSDPLVSFEYAVDTIINEGLLSLQQEA